MTFTCSGVGQVARVREGLAVATRLLDEDTPNLRTAIEVVDGLIDINLAASTDVDVRSAVDAWAVRLGVTPVEGPPVDGRSKVSVAATVDGTRVQVWGSVDAPQPAGRAS